MIETQPDLSIVALEYALEENWSDPIAFCAGAEWGVGWAIALMNMADAIYKNAPRCCDACGNSALDPMFNESCLPIGDSVGHEFCSTRCYDLFRG